MTLTPMGDLLLVTPIEARSQSKIIIPETAKEKPQLCLVVKLGTGKLSYDQNGKPYEHKFRVKAGDKVIVSKYGGTDVTVDGVEYKLLRADDVLAVID